MDSVVDQNSDLCRVSVYAGHSCVDVSLPAALPVTMLLPVIVDIVTAKDRDPDLPTGPLALCRPGQPPLDPSTTLTQAGIHDGTVLLLRPDTVEVPVPAIYDVEALAEAIVPAARNWTRESTRFAALLVGVAMVALSGYLAVPGGPAAPNMLLAAAAAATGAGIALRVGCRATMTLVALISLSTLGAISALIGSVIPVSPVAAGAVLATGSMFVLALAGRAAIAIAGLSPRIAAHPHSTETDPGAGLGMRAVHAHQVLTGLVTGSSAATALGVALVAFGSGQAATDWRAYLFAATTACWMLLRSRSHHDLARVAALIASGILCVVCLLVALTRSAPFLAPGTCLAAATFACAAVGVSFLDIPLPSPILPRCLELAEWVMMAAIMPLSCWICGAYGALRGMPLR